MTTIADLIVQDIQRIIDSKDTIFVEFRTPDCLITIEPLKITKQDYCQSVFIEYKNNGFSLECKSIEYSIRAKLLDKPVKEVVTNAPIQSKMAEDWYNEWLTSGGSIDDIVDVDLLKELVDYNPYKPTNVFPVKELKDRLEEVTKLKETTTDYAYVELKVYDNVLNSTSGLIQTHKILFVLIIKEEKYVIIEGIPPFHHTRQLVKVSNIHKFKDKHKGNSRIPFQD